jgi:hypothetical protein
MLPVLLLAGLAPETARAVSPCDVAYPSDSTVAWECVRIGKGASLESLAGEDWPAVSRFNRMDRRHAWPGASIRLPRRREQLAAFEPMPRAYAPAESLARFVLLDLAEQFLGAYEHGALVFSAPATSGRPGFATPAGDFTIDFADPRHASATYPMEGTNRPYPMDWALRFHRTRNGSAYWIHGRDLPGSPASHGCVGLVAEPMQKRVYGRPRDPQVDDARRLYEWAGGAAHAGPIPPVRLRIVGRAP